MAMHLELDLVIVSGSDIVLEDYRRYPICGRVWFRLGFDDQCCWFTMSHRAPNVGSERLNVNTRPAPPNA